MSTPPDAVPDDGVSRRALCLRLWATAVGVAASGALPTAAWAQGDGTEAHFWAQLKQGGCVALMCHAQTEPGVDDPAHFDLKDCATQRNLSSAGRTQSRDWGTQFVQRRIPVTEVRTSDWCRCKDTARLAFGRYRIWSPLNSFFGVDAASQQAVGQTNDVARFMESLRTPRNTVLITHQVNIIALTGEAVAMGEMVLIRPHASDTPDNTLQPDNPASRYSVVARLHLPA